MERELLLLTDYRGEYWVRHRRTAITTDLARLAAHLRPHGLRLRVQPFTALDFRACDYRDVPVLYQSSQDPGLFYKGYIEDQVLGLERAGAQLIPRFELFRAHHNKVFMEILRDQSELPELHSLRARAYGTYEDFLRDAEHLDYPIVLKLAEGDTARGVTRADNASQARRAAARLSRSIDPRDAWQHLERALRRTGIRPHSLHRRKLIAQRFVPGLDHDFKIVALADRLFVMRRPARAGDFRASGSHAPRAYPQAPPAGLLDFAYRIFRSFRAPFASIDVLHDGHSFYLGEIQFLRFGTGPVHRAPHHFQRLPDGSWQLREGRSEWERMLAAGIACHLARSEANLGRAAPAQDKEAWVLDPR